MSPDALPLPRVVVAAAVVEHEGRYLLTRRLQGVHLEGLWEFPGGKCERHETHGQCLEREMLEELGTAVDVLEEICSVAHAYPDRVVELHFYRCQVTGTPRPRLGQKMRWVALADLARLEFPPADAKLIEMLGKKTDRPRS